MYDALEQSAVICKDHEMFKSLYYPTELNRVESLKNDLTYYYGEKFLEEIKPFKVHTAH